MLTAAQQKTVIELIDKMPAYVGVPLTEVAEALDMDVVTAEKALRFSGFLVNDDRVS